MRIAQVGLLILTLANAGCNLPQAIATKVNDTTQNIAVKSEDCRQEMLARQEAQAAAREEWEACREAQREALRAERDGKTKQSLQAKVAVDMSQQLQFGQLQVDQPALEKLMAQRKIENDEQDKIYEEVEKRRRALHAERARRDAANQLQAMNSQFDCAVPAPCSCAASQYLPATRPAKRAISPTEIPFIIPVTLEVGMENGGIKATRMRRLPTEQLPAKRPCPPSCAPSCAPGYANGGDTSIDSGTSPGRFAELPEELQIRSEPTPAPAASDTSSDAAAELPKAIK